MLGDGDGIGVGSEGVLQKRVAGDAVDGGAALGPEGEAGGIGRGLARGHGGLPARDGQGLDDVAGGRLPQPVTDLVVKGFHVVGLDDACVVAQAIEELWAVGLRIDGLALHVLDKGLLFGPVSLGVDVQAALAGPDASHAGEGAEVGQGIHIGRRLGVDVFGKVFHIV